jgi:hypothetical protein
VQIRRPGKIVETQRGVMTTMKQHIMKPMKMVHLLPMRLKAKPEEKSKSMAKG